jgi:hypothetical protein
MLKDLDFNNNKYEIYYGNKYVNRPRYDISSDFNNTQELKISNQENNLSYIEKKESKRSPVLVYVFLSMFVLIIC